MDMFQVFVNRQSTVFASKDAGPGFEIQLRDRHISYLGIARLFSIFTFFCTNTPLERLQLQHMDIAESFDS
jgi:hypothetical protein